MRRTVCLLTVIGLLGGFVNALAIGSEEATRIVTRAYEDVLGRKPDPDGLATFRGNIVDRGWNEEKVRAALRKSDEYKTKQADIIIKNAFQDLLGRKPDPEGYKDYHNRIVNKGWDEQKVRRSLKKSVEYKQKQKK